MICGACVEGFGTGAGSGGDPIDFSFKGFIMDKCPECSTSDLDFGMDGDGRWEIVWNFVECPYEREPYFAFEGSHSFYWKISARAFAAPVTKLFVNDHEFTRTDDNFFEGLGDVGYPLEGPQMVRVELLVGDDWEGEVEL